MTFVEACLKMQQIFPNMTKKQCCQVIDLLGQYGAAIIDRCTATAQDTFIELERKNYGRG